MNLKHSVALILLAISLVLPFNTKAQVEEAAHLPVIGGTLLNAIPCANAAVWMLNLNFVPTTEFAAAPVPMPLLFQFPLSRLNANYNIWVPGTQNVGTWFPTPSVCVIPGTPPVLIPAIGIISGPYVPVMSPEGDFPFGAAGIGTTAVPSNGAASQ